MKTRISVLALALILAIFAPGDAGANELADIERKFAAQRGGKLEVSTSSGDIVIYASERAEVAVRVTGLDEREGEAVKMTQTGAVISVSYRAKRGSWDWRMSNEPRFEITVPKEFNLDLKSAAGRIRIEDPITGDVRCVSNSGDLRCASIDGRADLVTSSGNIRAESISGDSYVKTAGGDIRIEKAKGTLEALTAGGDIAIGDALKRLRARTSGGNIRVEKLSEGATLHTAGGNIRVSQSSGELVLSSFGGNIEVRQANGRVEVRTSGGDIRLENIAGVIDAHTSGGDIYAELMPDAQKRSALRSSSGDIELRLPESAKANIEARIITSIFAVSREELSEKGLEAIDALRAKLDAAEARADSLEHAPTPKKGNEAQRDDLFQLRKEALKTQEQAMRDAQKAIREHERLLNQLFKENQMRRQERALWGYGSVRIKATKPLKSNYAITSDFAGQKRDDPDSADQEAIYALNGGGHIISLETTMGNIRIKKLKR